MEKYGDRLTDRVRLRIQSLKSKEEKLQAEQQGLGDASLEKVQEWQQRLKEIEQKVLELEQRRKELEESHSTKQQIWNWQMELIEVEKEGERLKAKKEAIIELEKKWEHSSTALKLKPSIEEYQEASLECQLWNKKKEKVDSALLVKKQEEAEHAQKLQEWLRERDEQQPILQEYQSVLRYSMELLREMKELEKEILPLEQLVSEYSNQKQEWTEHYQKTCSELDIAYQLQNTLQREEEALTISFAERTKVGQACQEKKEISFLLKQKEEGDRELLVKQSEFIQVVERENQLNSKLQECQAQLESAAEKILEEHRVLHSIQSKLETEVYRAEEEHLELEKQWEKEKEEQLAVQLRERLQSGEPCPVCGSKDHR
ncbi:hypothetical protein [Caldalkalibacillus mannanilyticus]|uniref:hypothetical protein n=1 Tax=Caldalkalibacillus mannanilyticus TaxID=1418 RepID=UPI000468B89E|nr:hypothetical protein [Caldalkalibacillus mannanilyticus]